MNSLATTSITDVDACAPPIPHIDAFHQAAGPAAAIVLAIAVLTWVGSRRLHHHGWPGWARGTEVAALFIGFVGLVCAAAVPLSQTC